MTTLPPSPSCAPLLASPPPLIVKPSPNSLFFIPLTSLLNTEASPRSIRYSFPISPWPTTSKEPYRTCFHNPFPKTMASLPLPPSSIENMTSASLSSPPAAWPREAGSPSAFSLWQKNCNAKAFSPSFPSAPLKDKIGSGWKSADFHCRLSPLFLL